MNEIQQEDDHDGPRFIAGPKLSPAELYGILALRVNVFIVEQNCPYPELDHRDLEPQTQHLWWADTIGPIATLRIMADPQGLRIGRVATRHDQRGGGLGHRILRIAHAQTGDAATVLDAQSHLRSFYEQHGYVVAGPEFLEDGIPHLPMHRDPRRSPSR